MSKYFKDAEGSAAFPVPEDSRDYGMSLRDWFAGQALGNGRVTGSAGEWDLIAWFGKNASGITGAEIAAAQAYAIADAMLSARQRGEGVK